MKFTSLAEKKKTILFIILGFFFLTNTLVAEFMGVKIFSLEDSLGITPLSFHLFGQDITGLSLTCGVLLWPFVFIMTDIINEYYGKRGVRLLSWLAAIMIAYAFIMLFAAMGTIPPPWWVNSSNYGQNLNFNDAYNAVFGQGLNIIIGSLAAFLIGQFVDVYVFHWVKKRTGNKYMYLRATGSTLVSQLIDSFVVLFIAFYLAKMGKPEQWPMSRVLAIGTLNYIYKFLAAIVLTPVIYLVHGFIDRWLGEPLSKEMMDDAASEE
jgi:uncharacterized integral membrane protein (TIGR00697 family)